MPIEPFEIQNEKEEKLVGTIETKNLRRKQPAIVFLNGFIDTMEAPETKKLAQLFLDGGFAVVRFDYTHGFGAGSGTPARFTITSAVMDTQRVLEHAVRRGYIDGGKIVLCGYSFGGMSAIMTAAFDERVAALITVGAPYDFHDTVFTRLSEHELSRIRLKRYFHIRTPLSTEDVRVDYSFIEDGARKDMARAVRNLKQPTLILHGEHDAIVPLDNAQEIYERTNSRKELVVVPKMEHRPSARQVPELYALARAFLKKNLKI
jgi:uncharacterized protein